MRWGGLILRSGVGTCLAVLGGWLSLQVRAQVPTESGLFARSNLVAWCVVPFDARKRGPEDRARMLLGLGLRRLAYDWRAEHIPTFDEEVRVMRRNGIEITAWWFPGSLDADAKTILGALERNRLKTQLWVTGGGGPVRDGQEQRQRVVAEAARVRPIAEAAAPLGCTVALYNHGGWFGEPENQVEIVKELARGGVTNVGIVYNFHHGHDHIDRFEAMFLLMKPHLLALNLNGMVQGGDRTGKKILHLAEGDRELEMIRVVRSSGWQGPVGIIDHRPETDSEITLRNNLVGFDWLLKELNSPGSGGRRPVPAPGEPTKPSAQLPAGSRGAVPVEDPAARSALPIHQVIPAANSAELSPSLGAVEAGAFRTWHRSHGDNAGTRYSGLGQIHRGNVGRLKVAWTYRSGDGNGNIQCNPVVVDGVMFVPTPGDHVVAVDAATGVEKWRFKPGGRPAHRGLVYWPGDSQFPARLLFVAGNRLHGVDPVTGRGVAGFGEGGSVRLPGGATAAPAVFDGIAVVPGYDRDVWGVDVRRGQLVWTFRTIPGKGEPGSETWDKPGAGANCWGGMALDSVRGIAYITTGSPKPNFVGVGHVGDNLYANCLVALDARNGQRLWHFQEIRHDIWDLDIPAPPNLVSVVREGRRVDAVAAVTKLGNTLLLDRVTGKPLFPFRLRRAPTSLLPGEQTAAYQPDVELPEPFARQHFTPEEITERTPEAHAYVAARVAGANWGWFEPFAEGKPTVLFGIHGGAEWTGAAVDPVRGLLYVTANELPWIVTVFRDDEPPRDPAQGPTAGERVFQQACANCHGADRIGVGVAPPLVGLRHRMKDEEVRALLRTGRNLMPAAPPLSEGELQALLDFLFLRDRGEKVPVAENGAGVPRYTHNGYPKLLDAEGYPGCKPPWGTLNCIDLNTGRLRWKVPLGEYAELVAAGVPPTGTENFGGAVVTAGGLVFCAGTRDELIRAFDADTGREVWRHRLPHGGFAPPATYEVNGRQYVVIAATGGGKLGNPVGDAYVAFALE